MNKRIGYNIFSLIVFKYLSGIPNSIKLDDSAWKSQILIYNIVINTFIVQVFNELFRVQTILNLIMQEWAMEKRFYDTPPIENNLQ